MRAIDKETGLELQSNNDFVIAQWAKYPHKYTILDNKKGDTKKSLRAKNKKAGTRG